MGRWLKRKVGSNGLQSGRYVCWFTNHSKYRSTINHSDIRVMFINLATQLGHHLVLVLNCSPLFRPSAVLNDQNLCTRLQSLWNLGVGEPPLPMLSNTVSCMDKDSSHHASDKSVCMYAVYTYIRVYTYLYMYIYIERERDR